MPDTKYGIIFNSGIGGIWIGIYENKTICKFHRDDTLFNYSNLRFLNHLSFNVKLRRKLT